jgi:DNA-binding PadR family transcriptional regulator
MKHDQILNLDPLVHAPIRLAILSLLISVESSNFLFLKESIGTTDGNLSTHLTKLEEACYISIKKTFKGKKPQTICAITRKGREALQTYLEQLEHIIRRQKQSKPY